MKEAEKQRRHLIQTYGHLYEKHNVEDGCFYCQDDFSHWDHCPPLSWVESKTTKDWRKASIPFVLIQSCKACNDALGSKPLFTVPERLEYLEKVVSKKLEKEMSLWSEDEIEEMSDLFKKGIRARQDRTKLLASRLHYIQSRILLVETHPEFRHA